MFCKHKWEIIKDEDLPSLVEKARALGINSWRGWTSDFERTRIIILACENCGKLDKTIKKH